MISMIVLKMIKHTDNEITTDNDDDNVANNNDKITTKPPVTGKKSTEL